MSAFGRDLVGNANCGTANPLMQMAGQMQGMGAQLADVRTFGGVEKGGAMGQPSAGMAQVMRPGQGGDASSFMNAYQKPMGPAMGMPMHLHQQQQQQRQLQQMAQQRMVGQQQSHAPAALDGMADQFMQMELQQRQQKEFEHAFAQQQHAGPPAASQNWGMEFSANEAQHRMQQQQHMRQGGWANEFEQMQRANGPRMAPGMPMRAAAMGMHGMGMMRGGMPMGGMGMGMGMMGGGMMMGGGGMMGAYAPQSHMGPSSVAASSSSSGAQVQEVPDSAVAGPATDEDLEDIYAQTEAAESLEEAYAAATGQDWSSDFNASEEARAAQPSLGGGMDKDMLDALMKSDNPKWRNSKFLKFIDKISKGEIEFRDNQAVEKAPQSQSAMSGAQGDAWAGEYAAQSSQAGHSADWADQFAVQQNHPASWSEEYAGGAMSSSAAAATATEAKTQAEQWLEDYQASGEADAEFKDFDWARALAQAKEAIPERKDPTYEFQDNNPFLQSSDAFADGVRLFNEGKLKEAILAFEATVQQQSDHADAWSYLGEAQAHNEEENNAIAAFLQCVSIDPYNLKALMQLGVSYTNDLEESRALNYLKTWLQNNPDYQTAALAQQKQQVDEYHQLYGGQASNSQYTYDNTLHDDVTKMFLNALTIRPDDPDLHTVLGVLYHISSDFDKAIEAFKNAVKLKPDDPALWNKLGATQANSSRSSDAVHAYKRALQLRPTYVRTLANLAISYANQGLHEDAVRTYLTTLTHNPDANHVWSYLRISLSHLQREDLIELSHKKDAQLFRQHFNF